MVAPNDSTLDENEARLEFVRLIQTKSQYFSLTARKLPLSDLEAVLPVSIQGVFKDYELVEILYDDAIGLKYLKHNSLDPDYIMVGKNVGVGEYAVKLGDCRIYALDYELHPNELKPLYPTIYHWFIDSVKVAKEVEDESARKPNTFQKVKTFFRW